MTWTTTWPSDGIPRYAEHATEEAAARHAEQVVRAGAACATYYENNEPVMPLWPTRPSDRKPDPSGAMSGDGDDEGMGMTG